MQERKKQGWMHPTTVKLTMLYEQTSNFWISYGKKKEKTEKGKSYRERKKLKTFIDHIHLDIKRA